MTKRASDAMRGMTREDGTRAGRLPWWEATTDGYEVMVTCGIIELVLCAGWLAWAAWALGMQASA